jgi:hypothetical protein
MTPAETIAYNREACERVLTRAHRPIPVDVETLYRPKLCDTPFEVTEALVWAYRRIEEMQTK